MRFWAAILLVIFSAVFLSAATSLMLQERSTTLTDVAKETGNQDFMDEDSENETDKFIYQDISISSPGRRMDFSSTVKHAAMLSPNLGVITPPPDHC